MTERENFRRLLAGEMPEYIPAYDMPNWRFYPTFDHQRLNRDGSGFDIYGVEYVSSPEADGGAMSKPGVYILDDITKWRDVIKTPDLSGIDWEKVVKKDVEWRDPANNPLLLATHNGYFQLIVKRLFNNMFMKSFTCRISMCMVSFCKILKYFYVPIK